MNTERIGLIAGGLLIAVAVLIDVADYFLALGILGFILDIPATIFFGISFSHFDMSMMSHERVLGFLGTSVLEAVPVVDDVPWWTIKIANTVITEWRS